MDRQKLIAASRLERERAQKAQYTAMVLRHWSAAMRERRRALRSLVKEEGAPPFGTGERPSAEPTFA